MTRGLAALVILFGLTLAAPREGRSEDRILKAKFEDAALRWEKWCERHMFAADITTLWEHESAKSLVEMGDKVVPMIFERWKPQTRLEDPPRPPWWFILQGITGKKMVTDDDKLKDVPESLRSSANLEAIFKPDLEEKRWREWWQREGRNRFVQP
jgi:hypothetical protein